MQDKQHPEQQPFEKFEKIVPFIQEMASYGMVPSGSNWTAFLYELNEICKLTETKAAPVKEDDWVKWRSDNGWQMLPDASWVKDGNVATNRNTESLYSIYESERASVSAAPSSMGEERWMPFTGDYEKEMQDIKLHDGTIIEKCWPNAGVWMLCGYKSDRDQIPVKEAAFVRRNKEFYSSGEKGVSAVPAPTGEEARKEIDVLEGNRAIAEFMEGKMPGWPSNLQYHSSWDWLMPVVEKIGKIELGKQEQESTGAILPYYAHIYTFRDNMTRIHCFPLHEAGTQIKSTWLAVVDFIKWYKEQDLAKETKTAWIAACDTDSFNYFPKEIEAKHFNKASSEGCELFGTVGQCQKECDRLNSQ